VPSFLAFDIGMRRTGVAFCDVSTRVPLPLQTLEHTSDDELLDAMRALVAEREAGTIVIGLPLLLSGDAGAQSRHVKALVQKLSLAHVEVVLLDERYTTSRSSLYDGDAAAACDLLQVFLDRKAVDK